MKRIYVSIWFLVFTPLMGFCQADLLVHYPLQEDGVDVTGNYMPLTLNNIEFHGEDGAYSNGIYGYDSSVENGALIETPVIESLGSESFTIMVDFKVNELDGSFNPIVLVGKSWRFLGAAIDYTNQLNIILNGNKYNMDDHELKENQWYTILLKYNYDDQLIKFFLDNQLIYEGTVEFNKTDSDLKITNNHTGHGLCFKGFIKNIKVYAGITTSVDEVDHNWSYLDIKLQPTLVTDGVMFLDVGNGKGEQYTIYDTQGNFVFSGEIHQSIQKINLDHLPSGSYVLVVNYGASKQFIKL